MPSSVAYAKIEGTSKENIDTNIHVLDHIPNVELGGNTIFQEFSLSDQEKINKNHNEASHTESIGKKSSTIILERMFRREDPFSKLLLFQISLP